MQKKQIKNFIRGWIVGNFEPALLKTKEFEVAIKHYNAGDKEDRHVHKIAREITVVLSGKFKMNGQELKKGDIADLPSNEPSDFFCLKQGETVVIKIPSAKGDKYLEPI